MIVLQSPSEILKDFEKYYLFIFKSAENSILHLFKRGLLEIKNIEQIHPENYE
jgi:hypothetical protein